MASASLKNNINNDPPAPEFKAAAVCRFHTHHEDAGESCDNDVYHDDHDDDNDHYHGAAADAGGNYYETSHNPIKGKTVL